MAAFHISASPETLAYLHAKAAELGCSERRLGSALIACIARDDMAAAILDGERPKDIVPSKRRHDADLPPLTERLLAEMGRRAGADGQVRASYRDLAVAMNVSAQTVADALNRLRDDGRVVLADPGGRHRAASYRVEGLT